MIFLSTISSLAAVVQTMSSFLFPFLCLRDVFSTSPIQSSEVINITAGTRHCAYAMKKYNLDHAAHRLVNRPVQVSQALVYIGCRSIAKTHVDSQWARDFSLVGATSEKTTSIHLVFSFQQ